METLVYKRIFDLTGSVTFTVADGLAIAVFDPDGNALNRVGI